ncbi:ABC transporter ATP-binding protein [Micrococcoides hystricis]|uniref:ABC transporter ATP-binding protein n=1 Tax=Micrococcoides hystricis TaxID=1572761 RepID=A0ABV6PED3_9MICC
MIESIRRLGRYMEGFAKYWIAGLIAALGGSIVALLIPQIIQRTLDETLQTGADVSGLIKIVLLVLGLGILEALLVAARRFAVIPVSGRIEQRARQSLYERLQILPISFHDKWESGQLQSRAVADLGFLRRWIAFGSLQIVVVFVTIVIGLVLMFSASWLLGSLYLLYAIPMVFKSLKFRDEYRTVSRLSQDQAGDLATTVEEAVHGIRVLKAFGRGKHALKHFGAQADQLKDTEVHKASVMANYLLIVMIVPRALLAIALFVGIWQVAHEQLSVGALAAYFLTAAILDGPVEMLGMMLGMTMTAKTAIDRHFEVMDSETTITDPDKPVALPERSGAPRLQFEHVTFSFPGTDPAEALLKDIDFTVAPGSTVALVGATGTGKSTLLQLVPRLIDPVSGAVLIDGVNVKDLSLTQLRTLVSITFEDPTLFSSSIRENVLLGAGFDDLHSPAAHAALVQALDTAEAGFAYELPDGLDTRIGEEGLSLSGGQRQRLALARAIAANPGVLVLDDPLSALDVRTEEKVSAKLREVLANTTTLIVAHRLSTVALADHVAFLHEGVIEDFGTHQQLLARNRRYRDVISSLPQHSDDEFDDADLDDPATNQRGPRE